METRLEPRGGGRFGDVIDGDAELEQFLERCYKWGCGMLGARSRRSGSHVSIRASWRGGFDIVRILQCDGDGIFLKEMPF